jgi:ParB/RepB/Spo0J family partition protein
MTDTKVTQDFVEFDSLVPAPDNLRQHVDMGTLKELAQSIEAQGILQPLLVTPRDGKYLIVAGHRRWAAVGTLVEAGQWDRLIPVIAREMSDEQRLEAMLVENLRRDDLDPLEEATGYFKLVEMGMKQKDLAAKVGCSAGHISKRLSLLALPEVIQKGLLSGKFTMELCLEATKLADHPAILEELVKQNNFYDWGVRRALEGIAYEKRLDKVRQTLDKRGLTYHINAHIDEDRVKRVSSFGLDELPDQVANIGEGDFLNVVAYTHKPDVVLVHFTSRSEKELKAAEAKASKGDDKEKAERRRQLLLARLKADHLSVTSQTITKGEFNDMLIELVLDHVTQMNVGMIARFAGVEPVIKEEDGKKKRDYATPWQEFIDKSAANRFKAALYVAIWHGDQQGYHFRPFAQWVKTEVESVDWDKAIADHEAANGKHQEDDEPSDG